MNFRTEYSEPADTIVAL